MREILIGLPKRLAELRGNVSQAAFARSLGVLQQTYARWEIGDRQPKLQDLAALASHFGVTTDWLLGLTDDRDGNIGVAISHNGVRQKVAELKTDAEGIAAAANELLSRIDKMEKGL